MTCVAWLGGGDLAFGEGQLSAAACVCLIELYLTLAQAKV